MRVLVVNAGSSSLKLTLLAEDDTTLAARVLSSPRAQLDPGELRDALRPMLERTDAVGHRIVHGGELFRAPVAVTPKVRAELGELADLAPLHQQKSLAALDLVTRAAPHTRAVACFDTAFHATLTPAAATYALPESWRSRWGLRRYGFHGLSHAWVAYRTAQLLESPARRLRIVSCHLGSGASLCAIRDGASVDTTMGFTPLEGLVMATRSGSVDPGLVLWLLERSGLSERQMADALEHQSGLAGLAGDADMRRVLERAEAGEASARLALEVYLHRLCAGIAAMAAALNGIDALVFTGGVGEHAPRIRELAADGLAFLGVSLDEQRNWRADGEREIGAEQAPVRTLVLRSGEEIQIARAVRSLLSESPAP